MWQALFTFLQKIGKALMLPVSVLPVAGILLGIGSAHFGLIPDLASDIMAQSGGAIFGSLAIIFAIGVALGLTHNDGVSALAAVVGYVVLLATLGSVGIPLEGLAFIAGVDRILDMARTALNVVGNALAVLVIAKWEHKFDRKKALAYEREVLGKFDKTAQ